MSKILLDYRVPDLIGFQAEHEKRILLRYLNSGVSEWNFIRTAEIPFGDSLPPKPHW